MRRLRRLVLLALLLLPIGAAPARPVRELWFYYGTNLAEPDALARLEPIWRRAAAAGYSKVMLVDPKLGRLGEQDSAYFATVRQVKELAGALRLEIVPGVFSIGRSQPLLARDPDLAEALPVRRARFVARGGVARIAPDTPVRLGPQPARLDATVRLAGGTAAIGAHQGTARFGFRATVSPFRCYHVSVRVRTRGYDGEPAIRVTGARRRLDWSRIEVARSQAWSTVHVVFNSLHHRTIDVQFGDWYPARTGLLEWRNWQIEETGPVNVVRRARTPVVIDGLREGRDFDVVRDPGLGTRPWRGQFEVWHEPPEIRVRVADGTPLRVSWHHAAVLGRDQVTACLSEPRTMHLLRDEARSVRAAFGTRGYAMLHDEIRVLGWDPACTARRASPGRLLADHIRKCAALLRGARLYVWGDMFDPTQNAVRDYWLVNGNLAGSWEGLPREVTILNWNARRMRESLRFFSRRGHAQVICGYYDGRPGDIRGLVRAARGIPRVTGVMYTTWQNRYDDLEVFAKAARE